MAVGPLVRYDGNEYFDDFSASIFWNTGIYNCINISDYFLLHALIQSICIRYVWLSYSIHHANGL